MFPMRQWCLAVLTLVAAACTAAQTAPETTATTATTAVPATTTTLAEPCPGVFCLTYHIRPEAVWSDGVTVSADDFVHTLQTFASEEGYRLITGHDVIDQKTLLLAFSEVYGPWQTLFRIVLPSHAAAGQPTPVSGPFALIGADEEAIVLRRNSQYWADVDPVSGRPLGNMEEVRLVVMESARDRIHALGTGAVDVIVLDPLDWMVDEVAALEGIAHELVPGPTWEQITFNHADPLLSQHWLREAIVRAIDREKLLEVTVRSIHPEATALGSSLWPIGSSGYTDHSANRYRHDPGASVQALLDQGCRSGDDGVYSCQGQRLSFVWATTSGDEMRERQLELIRDDLEAVGIELVPDLRLPSDLFSSDVLFAGPETWQLINFSWRFPEDPQQADSMFLCQGTAPNGFGRLNIGRYCNPDLESLVSSARVAADPDDRLALYRQADQSYLDDLALIPLYQNPVLLAWSQALDGPELSSTRSGLFWNLAAWSGKTTVTVALDAAPSSLDPSGPIDDVAAMILSTMLQAAYGVGPSLQAVPVLVEEVEILVTES